MFDPSSVSLRPDPRATEREVYFVLAEKCRLVKIGIANHATERLKALRTQSPDTLVLLGVMRCHKNFILEQMMHGKFKHLRDHGEWFRANEELLQFVRENTEAPRQPRRLSLRERNLRCAVRRTKRALSLARQQAEIAP